VRSRASGSVGSTSLSRITLEEAIRLVGSGRFAWASEGAEIGIPEMPGAGPNARDARALLVSSASS
jgi:hypothetical protein